MSEPQPLHYRGNRTGVLLVHGFAGSLESLRAFGGVLAQQGWTVHGIWLAGHGTSEPDLATKTYADWLLSLRRGLHELQNVVDRIVIIGDSFGGNLALHASLLGPPIVGVVCLGTPVTFRHDLFNRALLPLALRLTPFHRKSWPPPPGSYRRVPLRAFAEVIRFIDRHTKREIDGVTVPLLIVQAKRDFEVHPHSAFFLFEHAASQQKELLWVDERIHHVLFSRDAPRVYRRLIAFIRSLPDVT